MKTNDFDEDDIFERVDDLMETLRKIIRVAKSVMTKYIKTL